MTDLNSRKGPKLALLTATSPTKTRATVMRKRKRRDEERETGKERSGTRRFRVVPTKGKELNRHELNHACMRFVPAVNTATRQVREPPTREPRVTRDSRDVVPSEVPSRGNTSAAR